MTTLIKIIRNETQLTYDSYYSNIDHVYHNIILQNILKNSIVFSSKLQIEINMSMK